MKTISLKLPDSLDARVAGTARRRGVSKSALVREALEAYLTNGRTGTRKSVLDLVGDLRGCVEGPRDLSTNPKHLKGYGR